MEDNIQIVVVAIIAIVIMFIFPVYVAYEKLDDITYALTLKYTMNFVDEVKEKGYISQEMYKDYLVALRSTGNSYDIQMEHGYERFDYVQENSSNNYTKTTEIFSQNNIVEKLSTTGYYVMNKGDNFNVVIRNNNVTPATVIFNIITLNAAVKIERIYVNYGGAIKSTKWTSINGIYDKIYTVEI